MVSVEQILKLSKRLKDLYKFLNIKKKESKILELEKITHDDKFWNDPNNAKEILKNISKIKIWITSYNKVKNLLDELFILNEFYKEGECTEKELNQQYKKSLHAVEDLEIKNMLSSKEDNMSAIITINPGAGGTESQDWAEMIMRMYMKISI